MRTYIVKTTWEQTAEVVTDADLEADYNWPYEVWEQVDQQTSSKRLVDWEVLSVSDD